MKHVTLILLALGLAAIVPANAQHPEFTVSDLQIGWLETSTPPEYTCIGGELVLPAPPYYLPCSEDTKHVITRNAVQKWESLSSLPELAGPITFEINCNLSAEYRGPCWGTFRWEAEDGWWGGSWTAPVMDLLTYESTMSMVGLGMGGTVAGKQLTFDGGSAPFDWYISGTARIH